MSKIVEDRILKKYKRFCILYAWCADVRTPIPSPHIGNRRHSSDVAWKERDIGLDHIEVYAIRYSLYAIRFALRHRRHSSDIAWKERNLVCGGDRIV